MFFGALCVLSVSVLRYLAISVYNQTENFTFILHELHQCTVHAVQMLRLA